MGRCLSIAVLVLGACGGGETASDAGAMRIECEPGAQTCPAGQTCDLICDGAGSKIGCRPAGTVPAGATCTMVGACAAATGCFATGAAAQSCIRFCRTQADCVQGTCQERQVVRICAPSQINYMIKFCLP